jgi:hypothetical protein
MAFPWQERVNFRIPEDQGWVVRSPIRFAQPNTRDLVFTAVPTADAVEVEPELWTVPLAGQALAPDGTALPDVTVKVHGTSGKVGTTRTDSDGRYSMEMPIVVPWGDNTAVGDLVFLAVTSDGSLGLRSVVHFNEQRKIDFLLHLKPALTVTGRVIDEEGEPVAGADVWVRYEDPNLPPPAAAVTDQKGRYSVPGVVPGMPSTVVARAAGLAKPRAPRTFVDLTAQTAPDVVLRPTTSFVTGRVVTEADGLPLGGATVSVQAYEDKKLAVQTAEDGSFRVEKLVVGGHPLDFFVRKPDPDVHGGCWEGWARISPGAVGVEIRAAPPGDAW